MFTEGRSPQTPPVAPLRILAISCNSQSSKNNVKILAHRGLCSSGTKFVTDENSLDALRRAQEAHVDGVEFDVHITADGLNCQKSLFEDIRAYRLPFGNQMYFLSFKTETCDEVLRQEPGARVLLNSSNLHHSLPHKEVKVAEDFHFDWATTDFYDVIK